MLNKIIISVLLFLGVSLHAQEMHDISFPARQKNSHIPISYWQIYSTKYNSIQFGSGAVYRFGLNYLDNGIVRDEYPKTRKFEEGEACSTEPSVLCSGIRGTSSFGYVQFGSGRIYYFNSPMFIDQAYYSR